MQAETFLLKTSVTMRAKALKITVERIDTTLTRLEDLQESILTMLNVNKLATVDHEKAIAILDKPIARGKGMNAVHVLKDIKDLKDLNDQNQSPQNQIVV
jgi:hypothetical protein